MTKPSKLPNQSVIGQAHPNTAIDSPTPVASWGPITQHYSVVVEGGAPRIVATTRREVSEYPNEGTKGDSAAKTP